MKQSSGFVLICVLLFMQLFSLISLFSMSTASAIMKSNNHLWQGLTFRLQCDGILQQLESSIMTNGTACSIPITPATVLAQKAMAWWQLNTCRDNVNEIRYYVVEILGMTLAQLLKYHGNQNVMLYMRTHAHC